MLKLFLFFCVQTSVLCKNVPYVQLEDDFYSEIRNILADHYTGKGASGFVHPRELQGWNQGVIWGQISGVAIDPEDNPIVLHRGSRLWDQSSFNESHHFQEDNLSDDPIVVLDPLTGIVLKSWGKGRFAMPHGITVDEQGNVWVTDVGLHQVFKFPVGSTEASLTLGVAREPGSDDHHFCQPTAVAVASSGEFFVADGYCNARVIKFNSDGKINAIFGQGGIEFSLRVPHALALDEKRNLLCIADRENRRTICVKSGLMKTGSMKTGSMKTGSMKKGSMKGHQEFGEAVLDFQDPAQGRVYGIAVSDGVLVGVSGGDEETLATGFTIDLDSGDYVDAWAPVLGFHNPHAIAMNKDGNAIYVGEVGPNKLWKFLVDDSVYS